MIVRQYKCYISQSSFIKIYLITQNTRPLKIGFKIEHSMRLVRSLLIVGIRTDGRTDMTLTTYGLWNTFSEYTTIENIKIFNFHFEETNKNYECLYARGSVKFPHKL